MAKATPLSGYLMDTETQQPAAIIQRSPIKEAPKAVKKAAKPEPLTPLQIRIPASEAKAIKRAALDADQRISEFMLTCFHKYMKR
jgi:hypothetical protein